MSVERLFCFDPTLGGEETAERKILYFYPTSTPIDEQARRHHCCDGRGSHAVPPNATRCR